MTLSDAPLHFERSGRPLNGCSVPNRLEPPATGTAISIESGVITHFTAIRTPARVHASAG